MFCWVLFLDNKNQVLLFKLSVPHTNISGGNLLHNPWLTSLACWLTNYSFMPNLKKTVLPLSGPTKDVKSSVPVTEKCLSQKVFNIRPVFLCSRMSGRGHAQWDAALCQNGSVLGTAINICLLLAISWSELGTISWCGWLERRRVGRHTANSPGQSWGLEKCFLPLRPP